MLVRLLRHTPDPEKTCALAARLCYASLSIDGLSRKMTSPKVKDLLGRVIASGHHSVLEHASFTFGIEGVSRALLAQLSRHRIASFSVQSQRYVRFKGALEAVTPPSIGRQKKLAAGFAALLDETKRFYDRLVEAGVPAEDARYILPQAAATKLVVTMNARELRHFFSLRCCNRAQWEIRAMAASMLSQARKAAPALFADSGPECVRGECREMSPCGRPWKRRAPGSRKG